MKYKMEVLEEDSLGEVVFKITREDGKFVEVIVPFDYKFLGQDDGCMHDGKRYGLNLLTKYHCF